MVGLNWAREVPVLIDRADGTPFTPGFAPEIPGDSHACEKEEEQIAVILRQIQEIIEKIWTAFVPIYE